MTEQTPKKSEEKLCALCPKLCRFSCPVTSGTADESATPTAMMELLLNARSGNLDWEEAAEILQRCTGCEACRVPCEYDQDVPELLYGARAEAWTAVGPPSGLQALHETHLQTGNPFGADLKEILQKETQPEDFNRKGRVLYWPGCRGLSEQGDRLGKEMRLLRLLGAEHVSLPSREDVPGCCGGALRAMGDRLGLQSSAAGLQQYFNRQRTWVSASATCVHTLRQGYPSVGIRINAEVLHLGQYLLFFRSKLEELGRSAAEHRAAMGIPNPQVFLHSSCTLHRRLGRAEPTTEAITAMLGEAPLPLPPGPDRSTCCGAGDFHDLRRPEAASEVASWSAEQSPIPSGSWLITGDSSCRNALEVGYGPNIRVFDLMGFLLAWLEPVLSEASESAPNS